MREFRFRVWDDESRMMIPPSEVRLAFVFFPHKSVPRAFLYDSTSEEWKPIPLGQTMASTYRLDNKGREIFEGDFIQTADGYQKVRDEHDTFAAMLDQFNHPSRLPLDGVMRSVMAGNFGEDGSQMMLRLLNGSAFTEAWEAETGGPAGSVGHTG
jgi:hypothetical protein